MTCFKALGWSFRHTFSTCTPPISRPATCLLPYNPDEKRKKPRKRLPDACRAYGIDGWENIDKEEIAKDIGEGHWQIYGTRNVLPLLRRRRAHVGCDFCAGMCAGQRLAILLPAIDVERVLHWSNYSAKSLR